LHLFFKDHKHRAGFNSRSSRPGGAGAMDIYASAHRNGRWEAPRNVGSAVNGSTDIYRIELSALKLDQ
jgi:hypothetical protein